MRLPLSLCHASPATDPPPRTRRDRRIWLLTFTSLALTFSCSQSIAADKKNSSAKKATQSLVRNAKGSLVLVGGGRLPDSIRDRFVELSGGKNAKLIVVPTANARADNGGVTPSYLYWQSQDVSSVEM